MSDTLYVNKPGGAIVQMADGSSENFGYGAVIDPDKVSEAQKPHLGRITDTNRKSVSPDQESANERLKAAYQSAATVDGGQVNSSANVVPSDYGSLDEDGAIALIRALEDYPEAQAQVVLHERVNYGRERVLDAASNEAKQSADYLLDQVKDQVLRTHTVVREPFIETGETPSGVDTAVDVDSLKKDDLQTLAREKGLDDSGTVADLKERLSAADQGSTPPPAS